MKLVRTFSKRESRSHGARSHTSSGGLGALVEPVERRLLFALFVVTTTADSGPGSFRQAITDANASLNDPFDPDTIVFNIPGTGVHTITPLSPLPAITDPVTIDASGPDGVTPSVELDGSLAGAGADGLEFASTDSIFASFVTGFYINSFSGNGIHITGNSNGVGLNYIGLDPSGAAAGNGGAGILIESSNNFASDNVIAFNGGDGITVASGRGNDVAVNNIYSNGDLGIDLGNDGVTPNDALDPDGGANDLQNFPVLDKPTLAATGGVLVTGTLNSTPNTDFDIAFYTSPTADGEGQTFRDHISVRTDASGNATFAVTLAGATENDFVTATATSLVFTSDFLLLNTSEFSAPVTAAVTPPPGDANHGHGNDDDHLDEDNPGQGVLHGHHGHGLRELLGLT